MMEDWNIGFECFTPIFHYSNIQALTGLPVFSALFHHSSIPIFRYSNTPIHSTPVEAA